MDGQFYEYGQDAGSLRWNQFTTSHYRFIYPRGIDSVAMDVAVQFEYFYPHQAGVLDHRHDEIPVIIHNEASFSNGVFVWAPRRIEIFTNPDPNGYPQDWLTELALHEGRHAFQVSKLNQGLTRGLSWLAGEQAVGAVTGFLPLWYLEGDAVDAETRFSRTGRGRMPSFKMPVKALLLEKEERYSYTKTTLGSYRDFIPNHYQVGYLMVRYGRRTFGDRFWVDLENYAARRPYLVSPTYFSMRSYGIRSKEDYYHRTMDFFEDHWSRQAEKRQITPNTTWNDPPGRHYTSYRFPHWLDDTTLVALKTGMDQVPEFITLDSAGREHRLFVPGYLNSGSFSYRNDLLVWDEWVPDLRWSNRNYSELRYMDLSTGEKGRLGKRTRYYSPAVSFDGRKIAATEQQTDHTFYLVVLDREGNLLERIPSPGNRFIQHPAWMPGDTALLAVVNDRNGKALFRVHPGTKQWEEIYRAGFKEIAQPVVHGEDVFFRGTFSGMDNIYAFSLSERELYRVTSAEFGAFQPAVEPGGGRLAFSDYHAGGYRVVTAPVVHADWERVKAIPDPEEQVDYASTPEEERIIEGALDAEPVDAEPKPYRKPLNLFNLHSWLPLYFDYRNPGYALSAEEIPVRPGVTLLSQNLLSTAVALVGYEYRDRNHYVHSGITLKGKYPVVDLTLRYGGRPTVYKADPADQVVTGSDNLQFSSQVYVPLRLNTGKFITLVQPVVRWNYNRGYIYEPSGDRYRRGNHFFSYELYGTSYLRKGMRDILPRWGVSGSFYLRHAPLDDFTFGSVAAATLTGYLPGFFRHHTWKVQVSAQDQEPGAYMYSNAIAPARGLEDLRMLDMQKLSLDYTMPVGYPDWNLYGVVYLKRIRANLWADFMRGLDVLVTEPEPDLVDRDYRTLGADLVTDLHLFRIQFPFSLGVRFGYEPATRTRRYEFLYSVTIN